MKKVVIIGNGIAGITAARHIRKKSNHDILVISGESEHFFSRTALMYIYMGHMQYQHTKPYEDAFWKKNKIELMQAWVSKIEPQSKVIHLDNGKTLGYDELILAMGSSPRKFGWPGQDLQGVSGLYALQDLAYIEKKTKGIKKAVVVGGGLIGIELAEMLHSRGIHVTFLVREDNFWDAVLPLEEAQMINQEITEHQIDLRLSTELQEIISDEKDNAVGVITNKGESIEAEFVGLTVGVASNVQLAQESGIECHQGILVDELLQTSVPDVYAIGDCAELRNPNKNRRAVEQVWYTGRMMGETVAATITGQSTTYHPGIWFNSAKFFNLEYQTYGTVKAQPQAGESSFVWQSEDHKKLFRLVFSSSTQSVIGVNILGIRMRHEVWDKWLTEGEKASIVLDNLEKANFDPEFFKRHESEIRSAFYAQFPMTGKIELT